MIFIITTLLWFVTFGIWVTDANATEEVPPIKIDFTNKIYSRLDDDSKAILSDYANVYPRIRQFYRNIRMHVNEKNYRNVENISAYSVGEPLILMQEEQYEVRYNDEVDISNPKTDITVPQYGRVDRQLIFSSRDVDKTQNYPRHVALYTPTNCYEMSKTNQDVEHYALNKRRKPDSYDYTILYFDNAPYSWGNGIDLEHVLLSPSVSLEKNREHPYYIDYARPVNRQGRELIEIRGYTDIGDDKGYSNQFNIYRFFKDTFVVESVYSYGKSKEGKELWNCMTCAYSGEKDGVPLLKNVEKTNGVFEDNNPQKKKITTQRTVWEITDIVPGPVPLAEFDVKQFLPPEADYVGIEVTRATMSMWRIVCIVLGIILLAIGIGLQIKFRKQNKDKPE
jgi:hypothetical protein